MLAIANKYPSLGFGLVLLLIVSLTAICLADDSEFANNEATSSQTGTTSSLQSARARFTLPKLFDFERYKTVFRKHYTTLIEEAVRAKLFLGRAFRAFLSAISYKHRKASYYLAINQMSDWTPEEVRKLDVPAEKMLAAFGSDATQQEDTDMSDTQQAPIPVVSLDEVTSALSEIVEQNNAGNEDSSVRLIAEELKQTLVSRRKRRSATKQPTRELSLDDIAREPVADQAEEVGQRVESNNPQYEPPEQASFGTSSDPEFQAADFRPDEVINAIPGRFLNWMLKGAANLMRPVPAEQPEAKEEVTRREPERVLSKPDEIFTDHRDECMFAPRNQGKCGSCYAFAMIAVYEWLYCKATGKKVAFSEQYIVDCGGEFGMDGCDGGYTHKVPDFIRKNGLELRANYPYRERADQCPYSKSTPSFQTGYLRVATRWLKYIDESNFERELKKSPMALTIFASDAFHEYGGGVHDGADCDKNRCHAMVLVGSGREDDQEYWLIRNSYSTTYGEHGYYKLSKKAKHCIGGQQAYLLSDLTGYEKERGFNTRYQSGPVKRRYHEYVTSNLDASI